MAIYFALAGILSVFFLGFIARPIGVALGVMDTPNSEQHKLHTQATPLVGAVLISAALVFLVWSQITTDDGIRWIAAASILMGILGVVDDRVKLSWHIRFLALWAIVAGLLALMPSLVLVDLRWSWGQTTALGPWGGAVFTALCLVGLVIALNMMDGYNGGVLSQCLVWALAFSALAGAAGQDVYLYLAAVVAVILSFNLRGKLFLGDGGAYALGILMGASAIKIYTMPGSPIYADTIVVWLALPVFDCLRVIFLRKLRGDSPFLPQRDHLHHLLMAVGGPRLALLFAATFAVVFGGLSVWIPQYSYLMVLAQLGTIIVAVYAASHRAPLSRLPAE